MITDLIQFLRERLAEDERLAQDASQRAAAQLAISDSKDDMHEPPYDGSRWGYDYGVLTVGERIPSRHRFTEIADCGPMGFTLTPHIAQHDPERVLREIDAKRQWLEALIGEGHATLRPGGSTEIYCDADYGAGDPCGCGRDERVGRYMRLLALPYAGHPEYRAEWRPTN